MKFVIKNKNKWGDILYQQNDEGNIEPPEDKGIWTIWRPSLQVKNLYSNCKVRKYGKDVFLLSTEASKIIQSVEDAGGSAAILTFFINGKRYFLCTIDALKKKMIKNAQGGADYGESRIDCLKREIMEELKIDLKNEQCKEIGHWIFKSFNKIVNTEFKNKTNLFLIELELEQISHLLNGRIMNGTEEMIIISTKEYKFELDETKYVVIFPTETIDTFPENTVYKVQEENIKIEWNGHHREALLRLFGKSRFKTSYLLDFNVNYKI
jgi:8-oxo-dGTP pyrophosphatase MutT (NUDIX family)